MPFWACSLDAEQSFKFPNTAGHCRRTAGGLFCDELAPYEIVLKLLWNNCETLMSLISSIHHNASNLFRRHYIDYIDYMSIHVHTCPHCSTLAGGAFAPALAGRGVTGGDFASGVLQELHVKWRRETAKACGSLSLRLCVSFTSTFTSTCQPHQTPRQFGVQFLAHFGSACSEGSPPEEPVTWTDSRIHQLWQHHTRASSPYTIVICTIIALS